MIVQSIVTMRRRRAYDGEAQPAIMTSRRAYEPRYDDEAYAAVDPL